MIYLDNAATTMRKPACVIEAVTTAMESFGGVGRGVHSASIGAGMSVYMARAAVASLFGASHTSCVAFGANATEGLNIAILGLMNPGDYAITTAASHNSVLRPLYKLRDEAGCDFGIARIDKHGQLDWDSYLNLLGVEETDDGFICRKDKNVKLVVGTHASNLTGDIYNVSRMARAAHSAGALFVLDAAQTAGIVPINMNLDGYDVVCFTGHKSLYGPQGTGGLVVSEGVDIRPLKEGGSGLESYKTRQPDIMPECLEAGTLNAHGIAGLAAGIGYVQECGIGKLNDYLVSLSSVLEQGIRSIPGTKVYGGPNRTGVLAFNIGDVDSALVADILSTEYGICTRAGAHCAPLMHEALGTVEQGAVRMSMSSFTTHEDITTSIDAVAHIAAAMLNEASNCEVVNQEAADRKIYDDQ